LHTRLLPSTQTTQSWTARAEYYAPLLILVVFTVASAAIWTPRHFFKFGAAGAGEAFEAYHGAMNLLAFGWQWAGLQDYATNPPAAAHPYLYIHHSNLGLYFSYGLARLGIVSIEAQNAVSWVASLVGLMLAYLFVKEATGRSGRIKSAVATSMIFTPTAAWQPYALSACSRPDWHKSTTAPSPSRGEDKRSHRCLRGYELCLATSQLIEHLAQGAALSASRWRREWDSNPRYGFPYTRFPSVRLQPLGHPSAKRRALRVRTASARAL